MRPKLKFVISPEADIENAKWFVKNGEFVDYFLPTDLLYIMAKDCSTVKRNKIIVQFTQQFYQMNQREIKAGVRETKKRWIEIEREFYQLVDDIFQKHNWPKGKYIGYASIYFMFPRDVREKTFYFPCAKINVDPVSTIAHELLHFIFFDYIKRHYGLAESSLIKGRDDKYVWRVSEVFNTVIENWSPYMKLLGATKKVKPYMDCGDMFKKMTEQWRKKPDIKILLDNWLLK